MSALPTIVAVLGRSDSGEFGNARCPHCGAQGRYVSTFLCSDGSRRGAMAGCIKLFPRDRWAALTQEAHERAADLKPGQRLASWWADILSAVAALERGALDYAAFSVSMSLAESARQGWLRRKGYGRYAQRRSA